MSQMAAYPPPDQNPNFGPPPPYGGGPAYPPTGGYPPPGQQGGYPGGYPQGPPQGYPQGQQGYPQGQPQTTQVSSTTVVMTGGCPQCHAGNLVEDYTVCGILLAVCFFPWGIICCLMMKEKRCTHCGARF